MEDRLGHHRCYRLTSVRPGYIKNAVLKAAFRAVEGGGVLTRAILSKAGREEMAAAGPPPRSLGFMARGPDVDVV